jgi:Raf kinase inhibitor-like YbhB/YbcL family protein
MRKSILTIVVLSLVPTVALAQQAPGAGEDKDKKEMKKDSASAEKKKLDVTSPAFQNNGAIPAEFTCEGKDVSVPLTWSKVPAGTKSVAILVEDPDAVGGAFTHWLVVGIPPMTKQIGKGATLPKGAIAAKNDKGAMGYAGPCPPTGKHEYHFRVYALDIPMDKAMSKAEFNAAIEGHVLAEGELVGSYQKKDDAGMKKDDSMQPKSSDDMKPQPQPKPDDTMPRPDDTKLPPPPPSSPTEPRPDIPRR